MNIIDVFLGRGWFRDFKLNHPGVKYATKTEATNAQYKQTNDQEWIQRKQDFMSTECGQPTVLSRANIFIAEIDQVQSPLTATVGFKVVVGSFFFFNFYLQQLPMLCDRLFGK